jgi:hypothetical protein
MSLSSSTGYKRQGPVHRLWGTMNTYHYKSFLSCQLGHLDGLCDLDLTSGTILMMEIKSDSLKISEQALSFLRINILLYIILFEGGGMQW